MTMTLIETKTLVSDASLIEFIYIPQDGTDLLFTISARSTTTGTNVEPCLVTFNSNTSSYTARTLNGAGSGTPTSASPTSRLAFNAPRAGTASNTFNNVSFYIPNYTANVNKSYSTDSVTENSATETHQTIIAGLWSNTSAITSVLFGPTANNFASGSTISLYKITKGSDGIVTTS
jgi:hypothetical protein